MKWELVSLAGMGVGFGAFALYLGYDSVIVGGVFSLLGLIAGYVVGKGKTPQD